MNPSIHHSTSITLLLLWDIVLLSMGKRTDSLTAAPTIAKDVKKSKVIRISMQFNFVALLWPAGFSYSKIFSFKANQFLQYLLFKSRGLE